ncbi:hypothetical protein EMQ25_11635 [Arsenicitalea aurantiaca]|uniref:Uncharacterized protein n=1 Tax=Arsenicitalea aurantiaca TaxID=1783274 RepID=A0A433X7E0_9HYPH|nr:hypothetical protein [Arsenicitalea aurantiaca]RUT29984.1 hypothetical protein EMQ25_11635 [Arsenicitalea aurantiaca]
MEFAILLLAIIVVGVLAIVMQTRSRRSGAGEVRATPTLQPARQAKVEKDEKLAPYAARLGPRGSVDLDADAVSALFDPVRADLALHTHAAAAAQTVAAEYRETGQLSANAKAGLERAVADADGSRCRAEALLGTITFTQDTGRFRYVKLIEQIARAEHDIREALAGLETAQMERERRKADRERKHSR